MTQRHTPGPWTVDIHPGLLRVVAFNGDFAVADLAMRNNANPSEISANARLIAAAPELASGCQAALAYLADPPSEFPENRAAAVEIIRAALAKAGVP